MPEFLKNDFVNKMQNIFKKKFIGDDTSGKKASQSIILDFHFGHNNEVKKGKCSGIASNASLRSSPGAQNESMVAA